MRTRIVLLTAALCAALAGAAQSQNRYPAARAPTPAGPAQAESIVVGVEGAAIGGTYLRIAGDLASALNGPGLRVVPIVGQGSVQNLDDLLHLRGVDVAIVQADALALVRRERLLPPGAERAIQYIAKLYDEEMHIIAGPEVRALGDLKGKVVNVDLPKSGSALTATLLFDALGIPVTFNNEPQDLAIERLKRGEIAAVMRVAGKPVDMFRALPADMGLHFLPLPQGDERLLRTYAPGDLTYADYPNRGHVGRGRGARGLCVAAGQRAPPPSSAARNRALRAIRPPAAATCPSQVERGEPRRRGAGLDEVRACRGGGGPGGGQNRAAGVRTLPRRRSGRGGPHSAAASRPVRAIRPLAAWRKAMITCRAPDIYHARSRG